LSRTILQWFKNLKEGAVSPQIWKRAWGFSSKDKKGADLGKWRKRHDENLITKRTGKNGTFFDGGQRKGGRGGPQRLRRRVIRSLLGALQI